MLVGVDPNIHKGKAEFLKYKTEKITPITLDDETLEDVESFTYLGSIIDEQVASGEDVMARIGKARAAFLQLKNMWNSKQLPTNIKILCQPTPLESNHLQDKELLAGQDCLRLHPVSDTVFFIFTKGIFDYEQIQYASLLIDCYDLADIDLFNKVNFNLQHFQQKDLLKYLYRFRITVAISDQNDNIPIFKQSKYYIKIPEHLSDGSYITEMKAHDLDKGEYGQLTYQLKSSTFNYIDDHDPDHDHDEEDPDHSNYSRHPQEYEQPFEIDPFNGIIKVLHNHLIDREQIEYFYLNILAIDKGNLTTHTQLIIQLIDINDHLPILYNNNNHINIDFLENQKINTFIDFIHLIDLDKVSKNSMIHLLLDNNPSIINPSINNQSINNP
ncbi:unnamed protein product [Schistosoma margrebowiei]|uniref:Uncharacterized protein n=1 Tax=Schistosoma margrebowiei TaxID=48269 RepID=A0A183NAP7_9TREM|nr:unnamed protein product [Schistosoma margrebowiei]